MNMIFFLSNLMEVKEILGHKNKDKKGCRIYLERLMLLAKLQHHIIMLTNSQLNLQREQW